ncbi:selenium cofactor biosynthesis protein YqeC [Lachnospiraceae bacterium 62-35]
MEQGRLQERDTGLSPALGLSPKEIGNRIRLCRKQGIPFVIALVGAGGKTTVMYHLSKELIQQGYRTAVTTTTHIYLPEQGICIPVLKNERNTEDRKEERSWQKGKYGMDNRQQEPQSYGKELEKFRKKLEEGWKRQQRTGESLTVGALSLEPGDKLSALPEAFLQELESETDILLVESDGSRHLPLKVPAQWEPVILPETSLVIGCVGLSALGKPWKEVCFRKESASFFFGKVPDREVTEERVAAILIDERGIRKGSGHREYRVILNQGDSAADRERANRILEMINGKCEGGICCSFCVKETSST